MFKCTVVFMISFMVSCFGQYYGGIQSVVNEELEDYGSLNILDFGSNLVSLGSYWICFANQCFDKSHKYQEWLTVSFYKVTNEYFSRETKV